MTFLNTPDAHPANLFALGQSLHCLETKGREVQDVDDLCSYLLIAGEKSDRLRNCFKQAVLAGMVTTAVEDEEREPDVEGIGLTESWHAAFGPDASMADLSVCINQHVDPDNEGLADLYAVGQAVLGMDVLGPARLLPDVMEGWNQVWKKDGLSELNLKGTQLDDFGRWAYFLGWVRRFGIGTITPDFSPWLFAWLDRNERPAEERASEFWSDMTTGLPLLAAFGPGKSEVLPEPISIALLALEQRGRCRFSNPSDSPDSLLTLRVKGKTEKVVKVRGVEWIAGGDE
jgi:hypothetical protein